VVLVVTAAPAAAKRFAGKIISKAAYFMSSGALNLNAIYQLFFTDVLDIVLS